MQKIEVTSKVTSLVSTGKHDHEAAERAIAAGYPAVESVLPSLLEWMQDINWPVAQTLAPFLASIGKPLIPHLTKIFDTGDEIWKRCIMSEIVEESPQLALAFRDYLERVAKDPTPDEVEEDVSECAGKVLEKYGWR